MSTTPIEHPASTSRLTLTRDAPLRRRFAAWAATRFPPALGLVLALMYLDAILVGSLAAGHKPPQLAPEDLLGFLAFLAFFLGLRIYDEFKDNESDRVLHADRLTVTGVMPLSDLGRINAVGLVLQAAACLWFDRGVGAVTITWAAAVLFSLLMLKEFFIPEWLNAHPVLYSVSHAGVMPLAFLWAVTMGARGFVSSAAVWWLCALAIAAAFLLELSRKLRAPSDERPGVTSYTRIFGVRGASLVGGVLLLAAVVTLGATASSVSGASTVAWVGAIILLVAGGTPYALFARQATAKRAKAIEAITGLEVLTSFALLLVVLIVEQGLTWR